MKQEQGKLFTQDSSLYLIFYLFISLTPNSFYPLINNQPELTIFAGYKQHSYNTVCVF